MTALHFRKNVREFFPWLASIPGTAVKAYKEWKPDDYTIKNVMHSTRVAVANYFMHNPHI